MPVAPQDAVFLPGGKLSIVGDVLEMMGQPLIPLLLLVLGANLAAGPGPGHLPLHSVLAVVATRLVLLPLLGCGVVLGAQVTLYRAASTTMLCFETCLKCNLQ